MQTNLTVQELLYNL